jgi:hypothetical protein
VRALLGAAFAAVFFLLAWGTANDMGLDKPGLLLGGAVLGGCVAGVVLALRGPRRTGSASKTMSPRARMSLTLGIALSGMALVRAAQGIWDELAVMLCVWLAATVFGVADGVRLLAPRGLAVWRSRTRP